MTPKTLEEGKSALAPAPAKAWQNWFRILPTEGFVMSDTFGFIDPGDYPDLTLHPTKEQAEQFAAERWAEQPPEQARLAAPSRDYAKFLGPFPVEEPSP